MESEARGFFVVENKAEIFFWELSLGTSGGKSRMGLGSVVVLVFLVFAPRPAFGLFMCDPNICVPRFHATAADVYGQPALHLAPPARLLQREGTLVFEDRRLGRTGAARHRPPARHGSASRRSGVGSVGVW